jgi:hypothetical protein
LVANAATSKGKVMVMPAYYTDASEFKGFVKKLRGMGYDAALPPIRWYNWIPTLGGRSVRPILDRMDYAITQFLDGAQVGHSLTHLLAPSRHAGRNRTLSISLAIPAAHRHTVLMAPARSAQRAAASCVRLPVTM